MHTACSNSGTYSVFVNEYCKMTFCRTCAIRYVLSFHTGTTTRTNTKSRSMKSHCNPPTNGATPVLYILDSVVYACTELLDMRSNTVNSHYPPHPYTRVPGVSVVYLINLPSQILMRTPDTGEN
jgi:hypothetical protein